MAKETFERSGGKWRLQCDGEQLNPISPWWNAKPIWLKLAVLLPDLWRQLLLSSWAWSSLNSPVELGSLHPLRRTIQQRDEGWWSQNFLQVIDVIITLLQLNLPLRLLLEHPHLASIFLHPPTNLLQNHSVLVQGSARTARWNQGNPQGNLHHNSILIQEALQYIMIILCRSPFPVFFVPTLHWRGQSHFFLQSWQFTDSKRLLI